MYGVFFIASNPENHLNVSPKTRGCHSDRKRAPARNAPVVVGMGFTKIHGFPGFGSKDLSNPKDDKTKNDAMVNVYPLECPKPIFALTNHDKSRKPVKSDPKSTYPAVLFCILFLNWGRARFILTRMN